jgi:hypothetical protein
LGVTVYTYLYYYIATRSQLIVEKVLFFSFFVLSVVIAIPGDFALFNPKNQNWRINVRHFPWLHTGDTLVIKTDPEPWDFPIVKRSPSEILNAEETNDLTVTLRVQIEKSSLRTLDGWAVVAGEASEGNTVCLVLKSAENFYVFPTSTQIRGDVSSALGGNYDQSGFTMSASLARVERGTYALGVFLYNSRSKRKSLKYVTKQFVIDDAVMNSSDEQVFVFN